MTDNITPARLAEIAARNDALEAENARLREIIVAAAIPLETLYGQIMIKPYKELSAELQARISTVVPVIRAALQPAKEPK